MLRLQRGLVEKIDDLRENLPASLNGLFRYAGEPGLSTDVAGAATGAGIGVH